MIPKYVRTLQVGDAVELDFLRLAANLIGLELHSVGWLSITTSGPESSRSQVLVGNAQFFVSDRVGQSIETDIVLTTEKSLDIGWPVSVNFGKCEVIPNGRTINFTTGVNEFNGLNLEREIQLIINTAELGISRLEQVMPEFLLKGNLYGWQLFKRTNPKVRITGNEGGMYRYLVVFPLMVRDISLGLHTRVKSKWDDGGYIAVHVTETTPNLGTFRVTNINTRFDHQVHDYWYSWEKDQWKKTR